MIRPKRSNCFTSKCCKVEKFIEKSVQELEGMTAEQLAGYYNLKNEAKDIEIKSLIEQTAKDSKAELKAELEALQKSYQEDQIKQLTSLNDALREQGLAIKAFAKGS